MKKIVVLAALAFSFSALCASQQIMKITGDKKNSPEGKITKLFIEGDTIEDMDTLAYRVYLRSGKIEKEEYYNLPSYEGRSIVIVRESGHDVVKLNVRNFDIGAGGVFTVDYLTSGISGSRSSFDIELLTDGENYDLMDLSNNKIISNMHFISNTFFGKLIGIKSVKRN